MSNGLSEALDRGYRTWTFGDPLSDIDLSALDAIIEAATEHEQCHRGGVVRDRSPTVDRSGFEITPTWDKAYDPPEFFGNVISYRGATPAEVLEAARNLPGARREWRCQHGRGGPDLCKEVHAYVPTLHAECGWVVVVPLSEGDE